MTETQTPSKPAASAGAALTPPRIGQPWPEMGGIYLGLARGAGDEPDAMLVLAPDVGRDLTWQAAMAWAQGLSTTGFTDWRLPTRDESALLYAHGREHVETGDWYWTSTEEGGSYAWLQLFDGGLQGHGRKSYEGRARAVRRFTAQSFGPSTQAGAQ